MEAVSATATSLQSIPLRDHAGYPPFLSRNSGQEGLLLNDPLAALGSLRSLERFTPEHREALADAIADSLRRWNAPAAALDAADELRSPATYAVVTGQQAGIAGGPLYTLYKAAGAVKAAAELARLHPEARFVPVFWIEGDDHDFDEARKITVLDRSGNPAPLSYDDGVGAPLHVGDRPNSADGIAALTGALRELLPQSDFTEEAIRIVSDSYGTEGETLADGFARSLYAILGDTPLVLVSSRNPALKRLAADILEQEGGDPEKLFTALQEGTTRLAEAGEETPIAPKPGGLFLTHEGERRSLVPDGDGYLVRGTDRRLSREEVRAIARSTPELLSPNVALRPIVQDGILPTAIYLGGPSEVAYLRQIRPAYQAFGMEPSAVMPRPFALIVEPKVRRILDGGTISLEELLVDEFDAAARVVNQETLGELEEARERALRELADAYAAMEEITRRIDPTLEKTLGAASANAAKGIDDLAKRLGSALKKKQQTEIDRLNAVRTMLMPGGGMQERVLNALYFIGRYGVERFRERLDAITAEPGVVQVIDI